MAHLIPQGQEGSGGELITQETVAMEIDSNDNDANNY